MQKIPSVQKISRLLLVSLFLLLALALVLSGCANSGNSGSGDKLALDYIGEDSGGEQEAENSDEGGWLAKLREALTADRSATGSKKAAEGSGNADAAATSPDSVQEIYEQGAAEYESGNQEAADSDNNKQSPPAQPGAKTDDEDNGESVDQPDTPGQNNDNPTSPEQPSAGDTVTMSINCHTAVDNGMHLDAKWAGIVPASGVILAETEFEIEDGDTALDVLIQARDKYKLHMEYSGTGSGAYVEGINNLYEFDGGRWSGWMYCVNGWYPNYGCGVYYVKDGDVIEWNYTCDLGLDLDGGWWEGAEDWKNTHE